MVLAVESAKVGNRPFAGILVDENGAIVLEAKITRFYYGVPNEGDMTPNITMQHVLETLPFRVEVHGDILVQECSQQIRQLA